MLAQEARAALDADGIGPQDRRLEPFAEMRYTGQEHAVTIPLPANPLTPDDVPELVARFNTVHERHYGHSMEDPVEIVTLRLRATGLLPRPDIPEMQGGATPQVPQPKGERAVAGSPDTYAVYERAALPRGMSLHGPAIVEEPTCTTVLHEDDVLTVGSHGELHIAIGCKTPGAPLCVACLSKVLTQLISRHHFAGH